MSLALVVSLASHVPTPSHLEMQLIQLHRLVSEQICFLPYVLEARSSTEAQWTAEMLQSHSCGQKQVAAILGRT